jgi:hypothetical protein
VDDRRFEDFGPPDELYGRVTDPERFSAVQVSAEVLIDELVETYNVSRTEGRRLDDDLEQMWPGSRSIRLDPVGGGAPLIFSFTPFPGVRVRGGYCWTSMFPRCGCDACNEDPAEEATDLRMAVTAVVGGGLSEWRAKGRGSERAWRLASSQETSEGGSEIEDVVTRTAPKGLVNWPAWVVRLG